MLFFISVVPSFTELLNKLIKIWKEMRYNITQDKNQKGLIMSKLSIYSNIGAVIGIGMPNQSTYRYSVNMKYKNTINTEENIEIKIPGDAFNKMEIREVIDKDVPIATVKNGIILLIGIFIL